LTPVLDRLRTFFDPYVLALLGAVGLATVLPCRGHAATVLGGVADGGIALLFFLYGGRLARSVVVRGMTSWRLQLLVLLSTFGLFPMLGLGLRFALGRWLPGPLGLGVVFLAVLPSTVQSSIAFTSIARGNVPAALCAATLSNVIGVFLTPVLVALLLGHAQGAPRSFGAIGNIVFFLLVPFVVGHLLRPKIGAWLERNHGWLHYVDRGSILLVVYVAFSAGVVSGIWHRLPPISLLVLGLVSAALLGSVAVTLTWTARRLGFCTEDEIAIVFCGSKKSLASGLPMGKLLFAGPALGVVVLPLMLFHQLQLMVCAVLARRYARRGAAEEPVSSRR
jgi:sodium/bile acid cotransporter 7